MGKTVIIGGVAGGMSAAARLRRNAEQEEIIVFEKGEFVSFANCGLPYYIGGSITERNMLLVQTPASLKERFNIDIRVFHEVTKIDIKNKKVTVKNISGGTESEESYDKLVLSPGAVPVKPPIPGIDHEKIFTLKNIPDTDKIKSFVDSNKLKSAVVVGGGYIGIEMAENLLERGIKVTLIEAMPQVLNIIDHEMASILHFHMHQKGVEMYLGNSVESFEDKEGKVKVSIKDEDPIVTDMVIFAIGVRPDTAFLKGSGIELAESGAIKVNEYMQTSDENVYAAGDAVEVIHKITGTKQVIPLAGPANKQGRMIADNIAGGNKVKYSGSLGTGVLKVFDMTMASSGASEKMLRKSGIAHKSIIVHPGNHAGYYPGNTPMSLKLIFSPDNGKILGVQAVGLEGIEKRVDVVVAYMEKEGTIYDLIEFEQSYAPPYSSAKDPVNMAGFVAENILEGKMDVITWYELQKNFTDYTVLDVRTKGENSRGAIPGAVNIPVDELRNRLSEVPKDKKLVVHCLVGLRSYIACRILRQNGFDEVYNLSGGYTTFNLASM